MKYFCLFLLLIWGSPALMAGAGISENSRKAYEDIICLRFADARKKIAVEKSLHPSSPVPYLLDNQILFLTAILSEEEKDLKLLTDQRDKTLRHLQGLKHDSPWLLYTQAELYFQSGFARVKFNEFVAGGLDINRAYRLLEENEKKYPGFVPGQIRLGLLHCLVGTVPDRYRWAVKAMNFSGTIPQGMAELKNAYQACNTIQEFNFLVPESFFILAFAATNLSGDKSLTTELLNKSSDPGLRKWTGQSPLMAYCFANLNARAGKNDEVIRLLDQSFFTADRYPFHYLSYLSGMAKLNRMDPDAHLKLLKYVASYKGRSYIRAAYQRLAWHYLLHGDMEKYQTYMNRIPLRGDDVVDNDREAMNESRKQSPPDPLLLKSRLLFDGGYYEDAILTLEQFSRTSSFAKAPLRLEYTYRKARVYDEWNRKSDAIDWYLKTIREGKDNPGYFAANASLHLGLIYENSGLYSKAEACYKECLKMDFEEYHFSITQKAKSGLNRIQNRKK